MKTFWNKFVLFFFLSCSSLFAEQLEISYLDFPPYYSTSKDGKAVGYVIDQMEGIAREMNYSLDAREIPMKRIIQEIKAGESQSTILLGNVFSEKDVYRSKKPILTINMRTYYVSDLPPVKKKEDLVGRRVGVFRGFTYNGWITFIKAPKNRIQYFEVTQHEQLLKLLESGRIDYALDYKSPVSEVIKHKPMQNLKYEENFVAPVWFFLSKKHPKNSKQLMDLFDRSHEKYRK